MQIDSQDLYTLIRNSRETLQRDVNRTIRTRRTEESLLALGGMDALEQLQNTIIAQFEMRPARPFALKSGKRRT